MNRLCGETKEETKKTITAIGCLLFILLIIYKLLMFISLYLAIGFFTDYNKMDEADKQCFPYCHRLRNR